MNQALWGSTLEYLLESPLAFGGHPVLEGSDLEWLRDWFCDYVRGGAALPALRIGTQPYGLLPVTKMRGLQMTPATRRDWLEYTLGGLHNTWISSRTDVPTLSPVSGGTPPGTLAGEEAVAVASVLGAVPHPIRLRLRDAVDEFDDLRDEWEGQLADFEALIVSDVPIGDRPSAQQFYHQREDSIRGSLGLGTQMSALRLLIDDYEAWWGGDEDVSPFAALITQINEVLLPTLERHDDRAKLRTTVDGFPTAAALPDADDPRIWYVLYEEPEDDAQAPTLEVVDRDPKELAAMLRQLADPEPGPVVTIPPSVRISLLNRLIRRSYESPPQDFAADLKAAVLRIADIADWDEGDPVGELERLTAETLGLITHRLDAWHASLAAERLAQKRHKGKTGVPGVGVQVGGYGWVVNLAPDDGGFDTQGFIHAPSLAHAATAAVLRSAWSAFSTDAGAAAFAVDLSSDRVRRAEWILGGMRAGQTLEELLGGRFERRLHDALLDTYIDVIREAVLKAHGSTAPASAIVDGLALAEAYADLATPPADNDVRSEVEAVIAGTDAKQLRGLLHQTSVDLDSVSDALTAQAVHSVLAGDLAEAAAAVRGDGQRRQRHPGAALRARAPRERPRHAPRRRAVRRRAAGRGVAARHDRTCAERMGRAAGGRRREAELPRRRRHVPDRRARPDRLPAHRAWPAAAAWSGWSPAGRGASRLRNGAVELPAELAALVPLRQAIGRARPLGRHDLTRDQTEPAPDVAELETRRDQVIAHVTALGGLKANDQLLQTRLADLVTIDDVGTIAALETDDQQARLRALKAITDRALLIARALEKKSEEGDLAQRLADVSRIPIHVLPRFTAVDPAGLGQAFTSGATRAGSALAIGAWLLQVGRVHPAAGLLHEGLGLIELVTGAARAAHGLAQLPDEAGEPWAAVARPRGGRTCIVSVTDAQGALTATGLSGLLFDAWSEPVPRKDVMTGVAVHFDSPSARPPQAVLLMTVPDKPGFNVDEIAGILRGTLDMARCRAIGTETLDSLGHYLPGLFLPEGYKVREAPA